MPIQYVGQTFEPNTKFVFRVTFEYSYLGYVSFSHAKSCWLFTFCSHLKYNKLKRIFMDGH
jgi:hypothetical protein